MAKQSCCHKKKLRRGLWSPEEDEKLMNHIAKYGHGCWSSVPKLAGLERCGKSCRLRWINYLQPDLKRGTFSQEEEDLIIHLHSMLGNKWSQIAAQLPGRTDNEVKNFWNSYVKKRLRDRGIDPATHQPLAAAAAADLIPTTTPLLQQQPPAPLAEPSVQLVDTAWSSVAGSNDGVPPLLTAPAGSYLQAAACCGFDVADAQFQQHCGVVVPSASSSSTLTDHCGNTTATNASNLPWLDLGPNAGGHVDSSYAGGHVDSSYAGGALDELRWSEYFDGAFQFQAAASQQGALQEHFYAGGAKDDVAVHFDVPAGLSNWC